MTELWRAGFIFPEEERNSVDPRQADNGKDDPADHRIVSAEYARDQIISEEPDEAPVEGADNN